MKVEQLALLPCIVSTRIGPSASLVVFQLPPGAIGEQKDKGKPWAQMIWAHKQAKIATVKNNEDILYAKKYNNLRFMIYTISMIKYEIEQSSLQILYETNVFLQRLS